MKAIRIHKHGGPEVLQIDEMPVPDPGENDVLIRIKACGMNHLDLWVRRGIPGVPLPLVMGSDGTGIIEKCGSSVIAHTAWRPGRQVLIVPFRSDRPFGSGEELSPGYRIIGEHVDGVQAEYVCVPQEYVLPKPDILSWEQAAAVPVVYQTAYHMLLKNASLQQGQTVLIWGASSGVGMAAIQLAKLFGVTVITTAGSETKMTFARELGADHVIDYKSEHVSERVLAITGGTGVDLVIEHVGKASWEHSLRVLKKGGKIITCGATTGSNVCIDLRHVFLKHQQIIGSTMGSLQDLVDVCRLIENKNVIPHIAETFPFQEVRAAHAALEEHVRPGKVILLF